MGFPGGSDDKESACYAGDSGSILGSGRSPGEQNGYSLQYYWLEKFMDRGTWQATVHGVRVRHDWVANTTLYVCISQLCSIFKVTIRLNVCTSYYRYLGWLIFTWGSWLWTLASPRVPPMLNSENPQRQSPQPSTPSPYVLLSEFNYCLYYTLGSDLKASYNS